MVTNFMHQNMSNNRIQRDLTFRPKIEDRIPIEKNPIGQVSGRRILCLKLGATVKSTQNTEFVFLNGLFQAYGPTEWQERYREQA
jgi:hypothetical protein